MSRREFREQLFKLLFRVEFNEPEDMEDQRGLFFTENEPQINDADMNEITAKFESIIEHLSEIDGMMNDKVTGWKTSRMGKVDLTILRIAVYEITFDESVPTGVAINEAVELAKKYGQDESPAFVNGVLAKFAEN
ncbi:MAG: transcription antitermination factor NusB [Lachnospiraceae bacterium]|nr:transcription antitermination factor NusB [Lachnospiraceae bacterium]